MLTVLVRCEDAELLAHQWSKPYPGYTFAETQDKLRHALDAAGPVTWATVMGKLGQQEFCDRCLCREYINSPITIGREQTEFPANFNAAPTAAPLTESQAEADRGAQVIADGAAVTDGSSPSTAPASDTVHEESESIVADEAAVPVPTPPSSAQLLPPQDDQEKTPPRLVAITTITKKEVVKRVSDRFMAGHHFPGDR